MSVPTTHTGDDHMAVWRAWHGNEHQIRRAQNPLALATGIEPVIDALADAVIRDGGTVGESRRVEPWLSHLAAAQERTLMSESYLRDWLTDRVAEKRGDGDD